MDEVENEDWIEMGMRTRMKMRMRMRMEMKMRISWCREKASRRE